MNKDEYVEIFNIAFKEDTSLSDDDVKSYLSEQEKITKLLGADKITMDMLGVVDMLVEGKNESKS